MKEIWMEKLVMLLDIYEEEVVWVHSVWEHITEKDEAWIISKNFWFISWLVENDKIDLDKVKENWIKHNGRIDVDGLYRYSVYERMLMLLSISDTHIDDLISYLK